MLGPALQTTNCINATRFLASPPKRDDERALIFEDDFQPNGFGVRERLAASLVAARTAVPSVDVLFLGRCHDSCDKDKWIGGDLYRVSNPACLHAYSVNRRAAAAMIAAAETCSGPHCPIDNVMRELVRRDGKDKSGDTPPPREGGSDSTLAAYAISPQLFTQEAKYRAKGESLVMADERDLGRMKAEGDHWVHGESVSTRNAVPYPQLKCILISKSLSTHHDILHA